MILDITLIVCGLLSKKQKKRCNKLNSDDLKEWREDYGYFLFDIETEPLRSKEFSEISEE